MRRRGRSARGVVAPKGGDAAAALSAHRASEVQAGTAIGGLLGRMLVRAGAVTPLQAAEIRQLAAGTWSEVTGGQGVALDAQGREIPPAGRVSADDEGQS